jgi:hypothetical protein
MQKTLADSETTLLGKQTHPGARGDGRLPQGSRRNLFVLMMLPLRLDIASGAAQNIFR